METTEIMMKLLKGHLKTKRDIEFYEYQNKVAHSIFDALIQNLELTRNATEEDVKKLRLTEIAIEFSRQSGKTTSIVEIIAFILIYFTEEYARPIRIGIFAPQREQAKTDFDRLKTSLRSVPNMTIQAHAADEIDIAKQESNAKTIVLPNGSSCYVFPVTSTSKPESKTLDLIIFEESQDIDDRILKEQIWPMGAATNAPRIYIGTAGTRLCHFRSLGLQEGALKLYFEEIANQRRQLYDLTGDVQHLIYEQTVRSEIENQGLESDEVQRPYFGKWLIGTGQFTTLEQVEEMQTERKYTNMDKKNQCFAGIDTAKHPDTTVVTVLRYNEQLGKKELINWLELKGENYRNQFEIIIDFLSRYNILGLAIDSTGQGQFMPDWIKEDDRCEWKDEDSGLYEIKFSRQTKDAMYRNLKVTIQDFLTTLPNLGTTNGRRFVEQMVNLQQQYIGQYLSVSHPDDDKAHDDYCDSWALAEWAYAMYNKHNNISISVVDVNEPERHIKKDKAGAVVDYWPGLEL